MVTPLITNLKLDPFERFHEARGFDEWQENRSWTLAPANKQAAAFEDCGLPRQVSMFSIDEMVRATGPSNAR
jgi:arylsulfatase